MHKAHGKNFLLASKSSSRYRLLKNAGLVFQTAIPNCDEDRIKEQLLKSLELNIASCHVLSQATLNLKIPFHRDTEKNK